MAHVFGHTDFFKHNIWFADTNRQMVESVSQNARRIREYGTEEGSLEVESFLDAVLSISDLIDHHPRRVRPVRTPGAPSSDPYRDLFAAPEEPTASGSGRRLKGSKDQPGRRKVPDEPEKDLLRFLLEYGDHLEDWQKDIVAIVREESLYFIPQMQINRSIGTKNWGEAQTLGREGLRLSYFVPCVDKHPATSCYLFSFGPINTIELISGDPEVYNQYKSGRIICVWWEGNIWWSR